jgi:hypothetical protein
VPHESLNVQLSISVAKSQPYTRPLIRGETGNQPFDRTERWRPDLSRMSAIAHAFIFLAEGRYRKALKIADDNKGRIERTDWHLDDPQELANILLQELQESLAIPLAPVASEDSVFKREGDYWTIVYERQTARLKATRGIQCLAWLLSHPGQEFHVSELITATVKVPVLAEIADTDLRRSSFEGTNTLSVGSRPILDAQAKAEYKRRLEDLQGNLEDAERFNDPERAAKARDEMATIANQLASALGLGGRDRRTGSETERARSAVTKRIKGSINRIIEIIPPLGRNLAVQVKTGYFCSYNPNPDHLVTWKF